MEKKKGEKDRRRERENVIEGALISLISFQMVAVIRLW